MVSEKTRQLVNAIKKSNFDDYSKLYKMYQVALNIFNDSYENLEESIQAEDKSDLEYCLRITKYVKLQCIYFQSNTNDYRFLELYWECMHFEAPHLFESYLYYTEKDRPDKKKFYKGRARTLKVVVDDLQDLEENKLDFYGLSMPPRVGKSTICIFFLSWVMGRRPNSHNAMGGHSGILADGFYDEAMKLVVSKEYNFFEIFPYVKFESKSAEYRKINLNAEDRFATLTCRGIDGTWTGDIDVSEDGYLYVDDLIRDRKESLSPIRLESKYQDYLNVMVDRKNDGSKELMVGTRWNILDPLGKIESTNKSNPRYRFRKIPALNENKESNFQYDYKGMSTEYFLKIKERLDKNEWEAKYQQKPFVREGLLFPVDDLRTYNGILPDADHRIFSACDVAWGGGDSLSMPIGYEYENGDVYIVDWIFNKGKKEVTIPLVIGKLIGEEIKQIQFEANNGGDMYRKYVDEKLQEYGYKCSCTDKKAPGNMEKLSKIIAASGTIIKKFIFLEEDKRSKEYEEAMEELTMFVQLGNNPHDDAADGLTQLAMAMENGFIAIAEAAPRLW